MATIAANSSFEYDFSDRIFARKMPGTSTAEKVINAVGDLDLRKRAYGDVTQGRPSVVVLDEGGGDFNQFVAVKKGITLLMHDGEYQLSNRKNIILHDYTKLIAGSGRPRIIENIVPFTEIQDQAAQWYRMVAASGVQYDTPAADGSIDRTSPYGGVRAIMTTGVEIAGIHFQGIRANTLNGSPAALHFGNMHDSWIHKCVFDGLNGYPLQLGVDGSSNDLNHDCYTIGGEYAKNNWFTDNIVRHINSQSLGVISSENTFVLRNLFGAPGKRPIQITSITAGAGGMVFQLSEPHDLYVGNELQIIGATGLVNINNRLLKVKSYPSRSSLILETPEDNPANRTLITGLGGNAGSGTYTGTKGRLWTITNPGGCIDFESNGGGNANRCINPNVSHNIFDFREASWRSGAIAFQIYEDNYARGGIVDSNQIWGVEDTSLAAGVLGWGITATNQSPATNQFCGINGMKITNNTIIKAINAGIIASGKNLQVLDNTIENCGTNSSGAVPLGLVNLSHSKIAKNTIFGTQAQYSSIGFGGDYVRDCEIEENTVGRRDSNNGGNNIDHNTTVAGYSPHFGTGCVVTYCNHRRNTVVGIGDGKIIESSLSNFNTYDDNTVGAPTVVVGLNSKIVTEKLKNGDMVARDGSTLMNKGVVIVAVDTAAMTNFARQIGVIATASHNYAGTSASNVIDGTHIANFPAVAHSTGVAPYTLEIDLGQSRIVKAINLYFYDGDNKAEPALLTAFSSFPSPRYNIQYLDAANTWVTKSTETNNGKVWKQYDYTAAPVTTTKIRLQVTDLTGTDNFIRVQEIEVFG